MLKASKSKMNVDEKALRILHLVTYQEHYIVGDIFFLVFIYIISISLYASAFVCIYVYVWRKAQ